MNKTVLSLSVALALPALSLDAGAQVRSSASYAIVVDEVNAGGGVSSSASYVLRGSIGHVAGARATSASYANLGGLQALIPSPYLAVSPAGLAFGSQAVGTSSAAQGVTLANAGNVAVSVSSVGITGANALEFGHSNPCGASIAVAEECTVSVLFSPASAGAKSATLGIGSSSPASPNTVALAGTGVDPAQASLSAGAVNFGARRVGTTSPAQTVTLTNTGGESLTLATLELGGANAGDFARGGSCAPGALAPSANCTLELSFTPTALGARSASVSIASNAAGSPHAVSLAGVGMLARVRFDFDGDGRSDVLWRHLGSGGTGENYLYFMDGKTILASEGYTRTVGDPAWVVAGTGDFDGDGKADILWRNTATGQNYVYFMDGKTIKPTEGYIRTVADQTWQVAGIGDFDGDGKDDILWRQAGTGQNYVYFMDGKTIKPSEGYIRTVADGSWQVAGVGDLDGDGRDDIVWRRTSTGENYVYFMDGKTIKPSEGFLRTVADAAWQVKALADLDGDGKADIVWRHGSSGQNYVYFMDGRTIKAAEGYLRTVEPAWQIVQAGDFDGDGKADLFWRNAATGQNYLYPMEGKTIKATEGYVRTVPVGNWTVMGK
jgi:hypothetical protein